MPMILCPRCPHCGIQSQLEMTQAEVVRMNGNRYIQEALPDWPAEQREMLITGIHPTCWKAMFSDPEDDDE